MSETARILLVGDDSHLLHATSRLLKEAGHEVTKARTGAEGWRLAQAQKPDLILLDVALPDMDGVQVCRCIKGEPTLTDCFVVMLSGVTPSPDDQVGVPKAGADGYIARPISDQEFLARVEAVLRLKRAEERVAHLHRVLRAINNVNQLIVREKDRDRLLQGACDVLVAARGYYNVWIALFDQAGRLVTTAEAGLGEAFLPLVRQLEHSELPDCGRRALAQAEVVVSEEPPATCAICPLAASYAGRGGMTVRLEHGSKVYGLLCASVLVHHTTDEEEQVLLQEIAGDIAVALHNMELEEERKQRGEERQVHLRFLESMDQVNRAVQGTNDLEQMMSDVLDVLLSIFDCDRAWLVYPCDPDATSWQVPMERTRPEYPGVLPVGVELSLDPAGASVYRILRDSPGPVQFGPRSEHPVPMEMALGFSVQSFIAMAFYPKASKPWAFGLHQCSHPRIWAPEEERLFEEIGRRLGDALTGLLIYRNLQDSQRKLEDAQRIAHVGHWDHDLDTDLITGSDETARIFGGGAQQRTLKFDRFLELVHPDDRETVAWAVAEALRDRQAFDLEYRVVHPAGEVRFVHSQCDVMQDELGRPRHLFGTVQDITERKQVEEALRASEERYRAVVESAQDAIITVDSNGEIVGWNRGAQEIFGYTSTEIMHRSLRQLMPLRHRESHTNRMLRVGAGGELYLIGQVVELHGLRKDRTEFPLELSLAQWEMAQGKFYTGIVRDITERKRAEEALKESESKYMDLYENAPDMYASVNAQTALIEQCNHTLANTLGYSKKEIIGRSVSEIYHPDSVEEAKKTFELFVETGEIHDKELQLRRKDGSKIDVSLNVSSVRDQDGNILYSRSTLRDITERKRNSAINASRLHLMQFAVTHSLDELLEETLNEAEKLSDSLIGFYHFVEDDQKSLTLQNWSARTKTEFCKAEGKGLHYAITEAGVWVDCVYQRKPVIHNDYASLSHRKGMPEGHAEVIRELVVPVLRGGKIKAILGVGNKPSDYTKQDVEAISLLADLAWETAERKLAEEALHRLNRELQALSDCNQTLLRAVDEQTLLDEICQVICDEAGYRLAWVGYAEHDDAKTVRPVAWAGFDSGFIENVQSSWSENTERGRGLAGRAFRSGESISIQDFTTDPQATPWRDKALQRGYRSGIALPLKDENANTFGVLNIYSMEPDAFTADEMRLMRELADDLAFGIIVLRARIKLQQSRQDLQKTNDLLRAIIEAAPTAIIGLDLDGKVQTVWNPAAEKMLGWSAQEVMGRFLPSVPKDKEEEFRQFREWLHSGKALSDVEVHRQKRDGTLIDYSIYAAPLHGPEGQIAGNVAVLVDITERKRAEAALQQRASQLALLNDIGRQVAALLDLDEVLDRAAHLVQELFGFHHVGLFTQAEGGDQLVMRARAGEFAPLLPHNHAIILGQGLVGWVGLHGETLLANDVDAEPRYFKPYPDRSPTRSELTVPIQTGGQIVGVLDVQSPQPNAFDENDVVVLETLASQIAIAIQNARLFTEAQAALQQLKKTQAKLVQSAKLAAIGELAAGVAHEINNPLTSILGFAELASWELAPDAPGREEVEIILAEARRARGIVRDLLDFARQTKPLIELVDLNHVLQQILTLVRAHVVKNGVSVEERYAPDLDRIPLDVGRMKQVFLNLITNAAHAMPDGGTLTVSTARVENQVTISIADTGRGIPPQDRERIFEPFFTTKPSGTGLGLSVSLGIVQQHGGHIEVESQVGKGSTFTIWLPAGGGR